MYFFLYTLLGAILGGYLAALGHPASTREYWILISLYVLSSLIFHLGLKK